MHQSAATASGLDVRDEAPLWAARPGATDAVAEGLVRDGTVELPRVCVPQVVGSAVLPDLIEVSVDVVLVPGDEALRAV